MSVSMEASTHYPQVKAVMCCVGRTALLTSGSLPPQDVSTGSDAQLEVPGAKKPCPGDAVLLPPGLVPAEKVVEARAAEPSSSADTMTSKDYYFDSYSHFGGH